MLDQVVWCDNLKIQHLLSCLSRVNTQCYFFIQKKSGKRKIEAEIGT